MYNYSTQLLLYNFIFERFITSMDVSMSQKTGTSGETFITALTFEGFKPTVDVVMTQRCPCCGKLTTHFTCEYITSVDA